VLGVESTCRADDDHDHANDDLHDRFGVDNDPAGAHHHPTRGNHDSSPEHDGARRTDNLASGAPGEDARSTVPGEVGTGHDRFGSDPRVQRPRRDRDELLGVHTPAAMEARPNGTARPGSCPPAPRVAMVGRERVE
jgi:hypothetical protein